jgi:hypothetical protein
VQSTVDRRGVLQNAWGLHARSGEAWRLATHRHELAPTSSRAYADTCKQAIPSLGVVDCMIGQLASIGSFAVDCNSCPALTPRPRLRLSAESPSPITRRCSQVAVNCKDRACHTRLRSTANRKKQWRSRRCNTLPLTQVAALSYLATELLEYHSIQLR